MAKFKVGDRFRVIDGAYHWFLTGDIVVLREANDDNYTDYDMLSCYRDGELNDWLNSNWVYLIDLEKID